MIFCFIAEKREYTKPDIKIAILNILHLKNPRKNVDFRCRQRDLNPHVVAHNRF